MLMFMKEKTYRFHGSLQQFISELMTEHDRLRAIYGDDHFTCYLGEPSSDPLAKYTRERQLIYWGDQRREGMAVKIVNFFNLSSLDGENMKLRANIYEESGDVGGHPALARWQETENLWISNKLMTEIKTDTGKKRTQAKPKNKHHPQTETINAINRLFEIRLQAIKNGYSIPTKVGAIQEAGTTFKTVQYYVPELLDSWKKRTYRPEKWEYLE